MVKTTGDEPNPIHGGGNLSALKAEVKTGVDKIEKLKADRRSINESIGAVRAELEAKGIPKKALDMAMQYMNMDPEKREGFDVAYAVVREAIGLHIANDLFTASSDTGGKK